MSKKRGLGRGLDVLLTDVPADDDSLEDSLQYFPLDVIQPGKYQPRMDMAEDALEELAESIRAQGVVQPIVVRPIGGGKYEIIAGERRWRAAQRAQLETIPALVRDVSDLSAIAMALIENIQRENLNPMEEANALHRLREEFAMTHQEAAEAVGRSRAAVSNLLRLRNLNEDVKRLVENGDIEMGHARALLALEGEQQSAMAREVVEKGLSVRETEQRVRRLQQAAKQKPQPSVSLQQEIEKIEKDVKSRLGDRVAIKYYANGKGKLLIDYKDVEDLRALVARIT